MVVLVDIYVPHTPDNSVTFFYFTYDFNNTTTYFKMIRSPTNFLKNTTKQSNILEYTLGIHQSHSVLYDKRKERKGRESLYPIIYIGYHGRTHDISHYLQVLVDT